MMPPVRLPRWPTEQDPLGDAYDFPPGYGEPNIDPLEDDYQAQQAEAQHYRQKAQQT